MVTGAPPESESTVDTVPHDWLEAEPEPVPALTLLAHPDPRRVGERIVLPQLVDRQVVQLSRLAPSFAQPAGGSADRSPLGDRCVSRQPVRLAPGRAPHEIDLLPSESTMETLVDGEPLTAPLTLSRGRVREGVTLLLAHRVALLLHELDLVPVAAPPRFEMVGYCSAIERLRREIQAAARTEAPVLLLGETGTGKELAARAIHQAGSRRRQPFHTVNLGALPPTLVSAELFGAAKGAYTGADRPRTGLFELADGGTLFLDEVGEAPHEVRAALLRVLETGEVQPVGSATRRQVNVRLIAATDRDLETAIDSGDWSAALLHRLSGLEIRLPPLRERRDDVGRLLVHFLRQELQSLRRAEVAADDPSLVLPAGLVAQLARHHWPGNVRELRNLTRELALSASSPGGTSLGPRLRRLCHDLRRDERTAEHPELRTLPSPAPRGHRRTVRIGHDEVVTALQAQRFNLKAAAEALGISRTTLYQRIAAAPDLHIADDLDEERIAAALAHRGGDVQAAAAELRVSPDALRRRLRRR